MGGYGVAIALIMGSFMAVAFAPFVGRELLKQRHHETEQARERLLKELRKY